MAISASAPSKSRRCSAQLSPAAPEPMMAVVAHASEARGIPCEVSLDSRMACGIGACRGCVKAGAGGHNLCVCTEGPVFDSREVLWAEAGRQGEGRDG